MPIPVTGSGRPLHPNIHICGNPATGKTTLAKKLAGEFDYFEYLDLGKEGKARNCIAGRDEELECDILDYEKLHDALVPVMRKGGKIVDWIHSDIWEPMDLVDLVVVLTCDNTILYDRYTAREYNARKIEQNIDSEIMQQIVSETKEYYELSDEEADDEGPMPLVMTLKCDTDDDMARNVETISAWINKWHDATS